MNNISFKLDKYNGLKVKGPLGELRLQIPKNEKVLKGVNPTQSLYRSLLNQMIKGVTIGHLVTLKVAGIFYKVSKTKDRTLKFKLGYSHEIEFKIPDNIEITVSQRPMEIILNIFGINLIEVTKIAAEIHKLKPLDRYKGQGIKYCTGVNEKNYIIRNTPKK